MVIHMPRMQVYLPEELYRELKERGLPASELLQEAITAEVRRLTLEARAEAYVDELIREVGQPSPEEVDRAEAIARRLRERAAGRAG